MATIRSSFFRLSSFTSSAAYSKARDTNGFVGIFAGLYFFLFSFTIDRGRSLGEQVLGISSYGINWAIFDSAWAHWPSGLTTMIIIANAQSYYHYL